MNFAIELHSQTERLKSLQNKMQEYLDNGLRLGWLIDPQNKQVSIYRPQQAVEILDNPDTLSGENTLTGFNLDLQNIF
jgi:Uma2 family endonuclease